MLINALSFLHLGHTSTVLGRLLICTYIIRAPFLCRVYYYAPYLLYYWHYLNFWYQISHIGNFSCPLNGTFQSLVFCFSSDFLSRLVKKCVLFSHVLYISSKMWHSLNRILKTVKLLNS